jgi:DNA-binding SARP family transcriptional activator/tetratricopeptide (TPR) repeat protein
VGTVKAISLRVLGRIEALDGAGRPVAALARRPKLAALLALCAIDGGSRGVPVEALCGLFWPDTELGRARRTLNQLVLEARLRLGSAVIEREGSTLLRVGPDALVCDAAELLRGHLDAAAVLEACRGELLPGVRLPSSPEFEDWLDRTRQRVRDAAVDVLLGAARAAPPAESLPLARRALELAPTSEHAAACVIETQAALGDRAAAWCTFVDFRERLSAQLDLKPTAKLTMTAARACGASGPASAPPLPMSESGLHAAPPPPPAPEPAAAAGRRRRPGRPLVAMTILALAVLFVSRHLPPGAIDAEPADGWPADVAVVVGGAASSPAWDSFLARELADRLAEHGTRVARTAGGRPLAPVLVHGRVGQERDGVAGMVQLEDARTGALLGSWRLDATAAEIEPHLALLADSIRRAAGLARELDGLRRTPRHAAAAAAAVTARSRLHAVAEAASRGARHVVDLHLAAADSLARLAAAIEPAWAQPHLLLAETLDRRAVAAAAAGNLPAARGFVIAGIEAATRAVELGAVERGLELRGGLRFFAGLVAAPLEEDAHAAALADLMRAVQGGTAGAQSWALLSTLHHIEGRMEDAYAAAETALRLDIFGRQTGHILLRLFHAAFDAGRDDDARRWCDRLGDRSPGRATAAECRLFTLAWSGAEPQAIDAIDLALAAEPPAFARLIRPQLEIVRAAVLASNGHTAMTRQRLAGTDTTAAGADMLVSLAMAHAQLGDADHALALLRRYLDDGTASRRAVLHSRWFRPLHPSGGREAFAGAMLSSVGSTTARR